MLSVIWVAADLNFSLRSSERYICDGLVGLQLSDVFLQFMALLLQVAIVLLSGDVSSLRAIDSSL